MKPLNKVLQLSKWYAIHRWKQFLAKPLQKNIFWQNIESNFFSSPDSFQYIGRNIFFVRNIEGYFCYLKWQTIDKEKYWPNIFHNTIPTGSFIKIGNWQCRQTSRIVSTIQCALTFLSTLKFIKFQIIFLRRKTFDR